MDIKEKELITQMLTNQLTILTVLKGKDDEEEQMLQYEREKTANLIKKLVLY